MIVISSFLKALECIKFVFGRGWALDPTGGSYSASPDPLAGLRALHLRREGCERGKDKRKVRERVRE